MTRPLPLSSYGDCEDAFTKALDAPNGVRLRFAREGLAIRFRQRLHKYRVLMREHNAEVYPRDNPNHGASPFDSVMVRHVPGDSFLDLSIADLSYQVEEL